MRAGILLATFTAICGAAHAAEDTPPLLGRAGDFSLALPSLDDDGPADAPEGTAGRWYIRSNVGMGAVEGSVAGATKAASGKDRARNMGVGVGYQFLPWLRGDITVDYSQALTVDRPMGVNYLHTGAAMANLYWDMFTVANITPYVGGGVGFGMINVQFKPYFSPAGWGETDIKFAWNATAGLAWAVTPEWSVDLNYRYAAMGSPEFVSILGVPYSIDNLASHQVRIGVRRSFN